MVALGGKTPATAHPFEPGALRTGRRRKALEELRTALALDDKVRLGPFLQRVDLSQSGKFAGRCARVRKRTGVEPERPQAKYHLAFVVLAQQQTDRGIKLMREMVRERPDFADARYELGKALLQKGDVKGSVEKLEIAARLKPDQAHVHYQLGRAYLAAGRKAEGESQLEISKRELKNKARSRPLVKNQPVKPYPCYQNPLIRYRPVVAQSAREDPIHRHHCRSQASRSNTSPHPKRDTSSNR